MKRWHCFLAASFLITVQSQIACAVDPAGVEAGNRAIATFQPPPGLKVELFAAEPMIGNPVAFGLDERNRVYVAEEYRFNQGTEENRTRPFFLEDDLQIETLDDRLRMYQKFADKFEGGMAWFSKTPDQVRLIEDRDGDGKADQASIFAGDFNQPLDGLAAGVLIREGSVYFTCIPHLWRLRDADGDGKAEIRESLLTGFGVNCAFLGHDLHGLVWGPDGKLYFSIGDRGFHVTSKEGKLFSGPRTGAVFRCNADGTELEEVCRGLRNPQELAFDQFGNLFAVDNNCDKGDHSRLVYVVEGGDSGWNMAYQTIPEPYLTGPWHAERMWHLPHAGQPAWLVPPVGKIGAGPSGFVFTSGVSLPDRYRNCFLYCNYTGNGGVEAFAVKGQGAGFEMVDHHDFLKPLRATDVDVGYDGKVYVSEFLSNVWKPENTAARMYTVIYPQRINLPVVREVQQLFHDGFQQRSTAELAKLLGHPDQRVRQRTQFALAEKGAESAPAFQQLAAAGDLLARIHGIWGLGQLGRKDPSVVDSLLPLLGDADVEIRAQSARVLGAIRATSADSALIRLLTDSSLRVRFFAAQSLGKHQAKEAIGPLCEMLRENKDQDPFLRHAAVNALAAIGDKEATLAKASDPSPAVRMGVLLALRRWRDERIAQFLSDGDPLLVVEAARAIHDLPIEGGTAALAGITSRLASSPLELNEPLLRRAIGAHFKLGKTENAQAVAQLAANVAIPTRVRAEALAALRDWANPSPRDRVIGFWRPLPARDLAIARSAVQDLLTPILTKSAGDLLVQAVDLIAALGIEVDEGQFVQWVTDENRTLETRVAALRLLKARKSSQLPSLVDSALQNRSPELRSAARDVLADVDPARAIGALKTVLNDAAAATTEKQQALATLTRAKPSGTDRIVDEWASRMDAGAVPMELQLDLVSLLKAAPTKAGRAALKKFESTWRADDPLSRFRASLRGGNAQRGRDLFVGHLTAQCIRCHSVSGATGTAGPDLAKVAERNPVATREHILESLILPNAKVAAGYGSIVLGLDTGFVVAGTILAEDKKKITLKLPDGKIVVYSTDEVVDRTTPTSAMPTMEKVLTPWEVRDLIEYLSTLK